MKRRTYTDSLRTLRECLSPAHSVLVVAHDYPDPDCLSSAFAVEHLCRHWGVSTTAIAYGGFVGRLENQALIRLCGIPARPLGELSLGQFDRTVLVDALPGNSNVSLPEEHYVDAVIDHHTTRGTRRLDCVHDIRPDTAATASIVTNYLIAASYPIPPPLATALFYGIKTDTGHMRQDVSSDDTLAYHVLFDIVDHALLAAIEDPPRTVAYFRMLHDALESAVRFGRVGHAHLTQISAPDHVAEMADFTLRLHDLDWMVSSGVVSDSLYFSVRCKEGYKAGIAAERISHRLGGSGGGHTKRAAGRVPLLGRDPAAVYRDFVRTFRSVLRIRQETPESILGAQ